MHPQDTTRDETTGGAESARAAALDADTEPLVKEWAECRTAIGRFDTILVDLRKTDVSLLERYMGKARAAKYLRGLTELDRRSVKA